MIALKISTTNVIKSILSWGAISISLLGNAIG